MQYNYENCPANWLFDYEFDPKTNVYNKYINPNYLKKCIKINQEESTLFEDIFEKDLEKALAYVQNDMSDNLQD